MSKGVLYDAVKCIGCRACQVACKQWNELPAGQTTNTGSIENPPTMNANTYTKIRFVETEEAGKLRWTFAKLQCMHCEHPACVAACPLGALKKAPGGAVIYDNGKCIGCRYCMVSCPFGVPTYPWDSPTPWVSKCTFCSDRQSGGLQPACVSTCPTNALKFGDREALVTEARQRIAASPASYVDHIYGEKELGGTSVLYLSPIPFEKLGFKQFGHEPIPTNVERAMSAVLPVFAGMGILMGGFYWIVRRRQKISVGKSAGK